MSVSDKVKAALYNSGKRQIDLAQHFGMLKQNMATKMKRNSWSAEDLIKVADLVGARVGFLFPDGTTIFLDSPDTAAGQADEDNESPDD